VPLEDILGITIGIPGVLVALVTIGIPGVLVALVVILRFRLKKKELEMRGSDPELGQVVGALCDDLDDTRAQVADMQERLDHAERMLASGRASQEDRSG
jgi:hypothetical protein